MGQVRKLLKENGEQPGESRLSYLKQELLADDWRLLQGQFRGLIEENFERVADSPLWIEGHVSALCGDYMDQLAVVWETFGGGAADRQGG